MRKGYGIFVFIDHILTAREIKKDPERRAKSIRFGATSVCFSVVAPLLCLLMAVFPKMMNGEGALLAIFGIAVFAFAVAGTIIMLLNGLVHWILQLSLNRRAVGWVALAVWIASLAGCAVIAVWAIGLF